MVGEKETKETSALTLRYKTVGNLTVAEQSEWLKMTGEYLRSWGNLGNLCLMVEAEILYSVWVAWEGKDAPAISREAIAPWKCDFYIWAKEFTRRDALREPAEITINNKISVHRDWVAERKIKYPAKIKVPKIKNPVEPGDWKEVEFDPMKHSSYGKLLVAKGAAKRNELSEYAWVALANPFATVENLKDEIRDGRGNGSDGNQAMEIFEIEGLIYVSRNGNSIPIMSVIWENSEDELFIEGIGKVFPALGLKAPLL